MLVYMADMELTTSSPSNTRGGRMALTCLLRLPTDVIAPMGTSPKVGEERESQQTF